jgi:hypothetical protein
MQTFKDWYWTVGGNADLVYSSKRNIYVAPTDSDFLAWSAGGNLPSRIVSEAEIWPYVQEFLPAWLLAGGTFAQPSVGGYMPAQLLAYSASVRYAHEIAGASVGGMPVATDRESQAMINGAYNMALRNANFSTVWKSAGGGFVPLDAETIIAVATAVGAHVASCFAKEAFVAGEIANGNIKTPDAIDAAYSGV